MKEILLISDNNGFRGGVEIFILNWIKHADKELYRFSWYIPGKIIDHDFISEFENEGVRVFEGGRFNIGKRRSLKQRIAVNYGLYKDVRKILCDHHYDIVHINGAGAMYHAKLLLISKISHVKCRIAHSHNTGIKRKKSTYIIDRFMQIIISFCVTKYAACSEAAAEYVFGKRALAKTTVVNNCIDVERFRFSSESRERLRRSLGLDHCFVIGHVGRFFPQKNHAFLVDIFRSIAEINPTARLLLVGGGDLEEIIREQVEQYHLTDKVIFAGVTDAVQDYLCAMDVFVLPSLYEGLGIVNIEAQANGLPCVMSDAVPKAVDLTGHEIFLSLQESPDTWADVILSVRRNHLIDRKDAWKAVAKAGYDISSMGQYIQVLYE